MERRNDNDDSTPRQSMNPNVFDDEYAAEAFDFDFVPAVADGFRPGDRQRDAERDEPDTTQSFPRRSFSTSKAADPNLWRMSSRGSTTKPPLPQDPSPFHDSAPNAGTHTRGNASQGTTLQHRASISSAGSFATMARSESVYGSGPSHPYGMYPQNTTVARSSSVTTSSTRQPQRSLSVVSGQRPAHPYGMYPQNVVEDPDEPSITQPAPVIPVGFPGLSNGFHRRIGPDGEEQDIIGPDGHTEQLPPYTRYPEEGPTKASLAAEPVSPSEEMTPTQTAAIPATVSHDALLSTSNRTSQTEMGIPTNDQDTQSSSELSATERGGVEKAEAPKKGWKKRRLWGKVPMGVVVLLLILVLVFAIILGAAIGSLVAKNKDKGTKHKKNPNDPESQVTPTTTMFDASPIPTYQGLQPLPTGAYALPLGVAQESSPNCLTVANQLTAWSCKMSLTPLVLSINSTLPNGAPMPAVNIQPLAKPDGGIQYGVQAPAISTRPLQLVIDMDYQALGPAYHFQGSYDKVVVLDESEFAAGAGLRRRANNNFRHRFQVEPGDCPWFCVWNQTFIEGYVYLNDNSSAATVTGSFMTAWPTSYPSSFPSGSPPLTSGATATIPPSSIATASAQSTTTSIPPSRLTHRDGGFPPLAAYPRIVKIEERRLPGAPQPYCQKMQLLDNGSLVPKTNSQGQIIKILLAETDPSMDQFLRNAGGNSQNSQSSNNSSNGNKRSLQRRDDPPNACHCQWLFQ